MILLRSTLFLLWFALISVTLAILFLPALILPRAIAAWMARRWCRLTLWGLRVFAGLGFEVRGTRPQDGVLIAAKHMSMWDTLALYALLDHPAFVLKRELLAIPFFGWYARKVGMVPINRDGGAAALRRMLGATRRILHTHRSVVIFPEGTRRKPGAAARYRPGVAGLYAQLAVTCVPVALNSGLFWTGPMGFLKKPGRIVLEFLEPIPAGLERAAFMSGLESRIESRTADLLREGRALLAG
jgi:1-acyl-sn-glycerol-3-phosphate acyltransferase